MKNISLLLIGLAPLVFSPELVNAQAVSASSGSEEIIVTEDTLARLSLFTGKYAEGTTYLHWNAVNQQVSGIYIIYRSADGINYEALGHKQGIGVSISMPIGYYFQDRNPNAGTTHYKLVHFSEDNTYLASERISVTIDLVILSQTKTEEYE